MYTWQLSVVSLMPCSEVKQHEDMVVLGWMTINEMRGHLGQPTQPFIISSGSVTEYYANASGRVGRRCYWTHMVVCCSLAKRSLKQCHCYSKECCGAMCVACTFPCIVCVCSLINNSLSCGHFKFQELSTHDGFGALVERVPNELFNIDLFSVLHRSHS